MRAADASLRQEERRDADRVVGRIAGRRRQGRRDHRRARSARARRTSARRTPRARRRARARIELIARPRRGRLDRAGRAAVASGGSGPVPKISDKEWKEIKERHRLAAPRPATTSSRSASCCRRTASCRRERRVRPPPAPSHDPGGFHYKCGNRGAIDVNFGGPGDLDRRGQGRGPDHRAAAEARLPHDLARGRPLTTTCTSTSPTPARSAPAAAARTAASSARSRTSCWRSS